MREIFRWMGRHEPLLWSALALVALGVWGFAELADEVLGGETGAFDRAVLLALRTPDDTQDPVGPPWLEEILRDFSAFGGFGVITFFALASLGYLLLQRQFRTGLLLMLAVAGGAVLSLLLKMSFARPRPELVAHGTHVFTYAFPSGHAMLAAMVYLTLGVVLARQEASAYVKAYIFLLAIVLTVLVGFSRVYLGVHWPTDVFAGWLAGAVWALLIWLAAWALQRRQKIETGGPRE